MCVSNQFFFKFIVRLYVIISIWFLVSINVTHRFKYMIQQIDGINADILLIIKIGANKYIFKKTHVQQIYGENIPG